MFGCFAMSEVKTSLQRFELNPPATPKANLQPIPIGKHDRTLSKYATECSYPMPSVAATCEPHPYHASCTSATLSSMRSSGFIYVSLRRKLQCDVRSYTPSGKIAMRHRLLISNRCSFRRWREDDRWYGRFQPVRINALTPPRYYLQREESASLSSAKDSIISSWGYGLMTAHWQKQAVWQQAVLYHVSRPPGSCGVCAAPLVLLPKCCTLYS